MLSCPLCQAEQSKIELETKHVFGNNDNSERAFYHCQGCDVFFQWPRLTKEEEHLFYQKEFEKFMSSRTGEEGTRWLSPQLHIKDNQKERVRREKYLTPHYETIAEGGNILEIGCSSGFMLYGLDKIYNLNTMGIEPSGVFSELLQKNSITTFDDMEQIRSTQTDLKFDLIMHFFVLEHIQEPVSFLKESYDLLKPGGKIICEIPNANDPLRTLFATEAFEKFYWSIAHPWYFTPNAIHFLLKDLCQFENFSYFGDQRYDIGNHSKWMLEGKPGGQGKLDNVFPETFKEAYRDSLIQSGHCDTLIFEITKS